MPAEFIVTFAERIAGLTKMHVGVPRGKELLYGDQIWFAPGGRHLLVERLGGWLRTRLNDDPPVNGCRPSADMTWKSAASAAPGNVVGVMLSGIGRDGRDGARAIKEGGGLVYVQEASTCIVREMPEAVHAAHLSDGSFGPRELAVRITRCVQRSARGVV